MPFFFKKKSDSEQQKTLLANITQYIAENYTVEIEPAFYCSAGEIPHVQDVKDCKRSSAVEALPCAPMMATRALSLEDMLKQEDAGFTETLLQQIDRTGKKDSEIYKKAGLTKQHFSKIRNNLHYKPTKPTAIALALALELDLAQTCDLIGRAGYALTNSSKFDLIIRYFIESRIYDVVQINMALYEFDQPLLSN